MNISQNRLEEKNLFSEQLSLVPPEKKEEEWFFDHYKDLQKEYGGGWIAIHNQKEAKQLYPNPYISFVEKFGTMVVL